MANAIEFVLNGRIIRLEGVSPNTTLLEYLRGAGLTGTKEGCAEGDCGACSVVIIDRDSWGQPCYRAINSCLVPLCLIAGREIVSVEGLSARNQLHPVQEKMVAAHGSQCGYCTPGFVMSLFEGYYRGDIRQPDQLDDQLCGNLCRCTGYRPIRNAALQAFPERHLRNGHDSFAERLKKGAAGLGGVEYHFAGERFSRPTSLRALLELVGSVPNARLIAGATELGLDITKRFKKFSALISVEAVPELKEIQRTDSEWRIGGAVSLTEIEQRMAEEFPALGDMMRVFGSRQIRNRATMGGNLVTASPIGDSAPLLLALDAKVVLTSLSHHEGESPALLSERTLPIDEFFLAYRKTALEPGEVLRTIIVPRGASRPELTRKCAWYKVSKRREMDISTVAACFTLDVDSEGVIRHARLAYGGVAAMPARARKTEAALLDQPWCEDTVRKLLPVLQAEFTPISDLRGSADYRRALITSLFEKFCCDGRSGTAELASLALGRSRPAREAPPHESAHKHVTGEAIYTDDQTAGMLEVWPVCSPHAHARVLARDANAARTMPGIRAVLTAEDVPGENNVGGVKHDEVLLADKVALFHGQIVALVVGETQEACRAAAEKVVVKYHPLPPILTLEQALAARSFHNAPNYIRRGKVGAALADAPRTLTGVFKLQGQEHFYLETQAAWAKPGEDGSVSVVSSTQHPSEIQALLSHLLSVPANKVVVQSLRMGGGFGGKETQGATPAALAALAARHTGQPVRVRWNRDQDMTLTGHRHPFLAKFKVGFDTEGRLLAAQVHLYSNGGWAMDLSQAVTDRALFHLDNAYYIPAVEFRGQVAKTNLSSNTAFRGFGGPQGMVVMEEILDRIARQLGLPPEVVRERNLYHGKGRTNTTPYGQEIGDNRIQTIWRRLKRSSDFTRRRRAITIWNATHPNCKRGLAITPVKFGISFTVTHLNQAGAFVLIYQDGTAQVNHAGTEMGQGLHTNITAIAARELGIEPEHVRVMPTSTDKVPNTSATAASCGTDLNGAAVKNACTILRSRLAPVAARLLQQKSGRVSAPGKLVFANGLVCDRGRPRTTVKYAEVVRRAYQARISLSATGYYATPGIHWDRVAGRGKPFHYFACGAAVSEVEVDGFTGMMRVLRADILHDVGDSVNEGVNRGQVEGGFVQGMGWLTTEELLWDNEGRLLTHSPDTYKLPSIGDMPQVFNVTLLRNAAQKGVVYGSKAVGEPPLMLAISVREAIRDAVAAYGSPGSHVPLALPATCEAIFMAIQQVRSTPLATPASHRPVPLAYQ
ncbi:MAG TPA: xanthine dehydrogenase molybdopterin binding subunit [Candidatus Paceibacterota bacterium]|nr:xanthine dehydrogenase molybdopterin binding subunit [Verrucomicrobiota bacterium]HSA12321.1 xanthine dehydrogenase molybdopterin binding subunit [Candidatus Paceibacterota bacterium]